MGRPTSICRRGRARTMQAARAHPPSLRRPFRREAAAACSAGSTGCCRIKPLSDTRSGHLHGLLSAMHPSFSVIFFTTASGAGYGLLALLGVLTPLGVVPVSQLFGFVAMALAFGGITAGLISSTFHLGRPERALRAFSQWRSSWLSREGVAAVLTYVPAGLFG